MASNSRYLGRSLVLSAAITGALVAMSSTPSFGVGNGYGPAGGVPSSATSAGFSTLVTAQSVSASGGTVSGSANGATANVTVPAGSLPNGGEVVIAAGDPSSVDAGTDSTVVSDFSVSVLDPNTGAPLTGPFNPAITLTISDPSIAAGQTVLVVTGPGQVTTASGAQVTQGQAVVTFTTDPNFAVVSTSTTPVLGATSAVTGKAFLGEGLAGGGLIVAGGIGLFFALRRRRFA